MLELTEKLNTIWMQPFSFNGINIIINYAAHAKHSKNWVIPPHYHPWFELNYVFRGSLYTTIEDSEFLITAGQSYMIPPGISHSHRHNKIGDDGICIRFSLSSDTQSNIIDTIGIPRAVPFDSHLENIDTSGSIYALQAEFAAWLMRLYDMHSTQKPPSSSAKNTFSTQVILYLEEYYQQKIKVADIANTINTSYRTLARRFLAETGITITEKLTQIRLDRAKQLLSSTKLPMYDVAAASGFENEFYFSRIFKQKENISPKEYRNTKQRRLIIDTATP